MAGYSMRYEGEELVKRLGIYLAHKVYEIVASYAFVAIHSGPNLHLCNVGLLFAQTG